MIIGIESNDFNLNIPRYIDSQEAEDIQDIEAHLLGDIPGDDIEALNEYWEVCPSLKKALFKNSSRKKYYSVIVEKDQVRQTIFNHREFTSYSKKILNVFHNWKKKHTPQLKGLNGDLTPKGLIFTISEDLLQRFSGLGLVDKYDVYQHLMNYWSDIMQDDVYAIVCEGWEAGREIERNGKKEWEGRLIPKLLMINQYFLSEQNEIEDLEADRDALASELEALEEENSGDDGLLEEAKNEKGSLTKAGIQKRIKEIKDDAFLADELSVLNQYLELTDKVAASNKKIKSAHAKLEEKLLKKYKALTVDEIKGLVVDNKWMGQMEQDVKSEMQRISQNLAGRIKELAERYESPRPVLDKEVDALEKKVNSHLTKMGFSWK